MALKLDDAAVKAVKAELRALGDKGQRAAEELEARGKREVFSVGGVGVTVAAVAAAGIGFLLGMWLG